MFCSDSHELSPAFSLLSLDRITCAPGFGLGPKIGGCPFLLFPFVQTRPRRGCHHFWFVSASLFVLNLGGFMRIIYHKNQFQINLQNEKYCGWTKSISHHGKPWFVVIYRGTTIPGFLRFCEMDFATIHSTSLRVKSGRFPRPGSCKPHLEESLGGFQLLQPRESIDLGPSINLMLRLPTIRRVSRGSNKGRHHSLRRMSFGGVSCPSFANNYALQGVQTLKKQVGGGVS